MFKTSIEKLAESIGFNIGNSDDCVQSDLINGFSKGLCNSMDKHQLEKQICYIVDKLDHNNVKVIKEMYEFIELKEEK